MKLPVICEKIFIGLRANKPLRQTCLVAVNESSVAVYPVDSRLSDLQRKAWRSGFKCGVLACSVALLVYAAAHVLLGRETHSERISKPDVMESGLALKLSIGLTQV